MNPEQFHELFGSQWPPDQHSSTSMMHHASGSHGQNPTPSLSQGMMKREPHTDVQGVMNCTQGMGMSHDISGSVADSTSPPPGNSDGMFGSSISGMFMDKKAANSIRGKNFFFIIVHFVFPCLPL